jgi:uroporphyrinogen-III synthase
MENLPPGNRNVLVMSAELSQALERAGARVLTCPKLEIQSPDTFTGLDEAIENLYGYDWLIFVSADSVRLFLKRLEAQSVNVGDLDSLRVCAIGESTLAALEESQVHIDLVPAEFAAAGIVAALATYLNGTDGLNGVNLLIPQATIGHDYLKPALENAGARADVVATYRTTADNSNLLRLRTLMSSGSLDCVAFAEASEVHDFARLFDTNDLADLLNQLAVACIGELTTKAAAEHGLRARVQAVDHSALVKEIGSYFA